MNFDKMDFLVLGHNYSLRHNIGFHLKYQDRFFWFEENSKIIFNKSKKEVSFNRVKTLDFQF